ncbi:MAG: hypothetical protein V1921_00630 [Candidatus Altiarchaeota archaeon]
MAVERRPGQKSAHRELLVGEEGAVGFMREKVGGEFPQIKDSAYKLFHSNHVIVYDSPENGIVQLRREPRFLYSQSKHGFDRLFYITQLAHTLFPGDVINMTEMMLPDNMPEFFGFRNPPTMADGTVQFPTFKSERIPTTKAQEKRWAETFELIQESRKRRFDLYNRNDGVITEKQWDDMLLRDKPVNAKVEVYEQWFKNLVKRSGLSLNEFELKLREAGFSQPHPEVNTILTPKAGDRPRHLVYVELGSHIDVGKVLETIGSLPGGEQKSRANYLLLKAWEAEALAKHDIAQIPDGISQLEKDKFFLGVSHDKRIKTLREEIANEKGELKEELPEKERPTIWVGEPDPKFPNLIPVVIPAGPIDAAPPRQPKNLPFPFQAEYRNEERISQDPEWIRGMMFGSPRSGHPEGLVVLHIRDVLENINWLGADEDTRSRLREIAFVHDTFKYQVDHTKPIDGENTHQAFAAKFAEKHLQDEGVKKVIRLHDDGFHAWQLGHLGEDWKKAEEGAVKLIKQLGPDTDLFLQFMECDRTEGKSVAPLDWFKKVVEDNRNPIPPRKVHRKVNEPLVADSIDRGVIKINELLGELHPKQKDPYALIALTGGSYEQQHGFFKRLQEINNAVTFGSFNHVPDFDDYLRYHFIHCDQFVSASRIEQAQGKTPDIVVHLQTSSLPNDKPRIEAKTQLIVNNR